jgi:cyclopropane fatty-acyl-phospholipid synthase-like methyltransferase
MSRQQLSSEAHRLLPHANPLSVDQMSDLLDVALAQRPRTALEVGCGAGEFSIELAKRQDVHVIALDTNPYALERAVAVASTTRLVGTVEFRQSPATEFTGEPVDLLVCIGSSHAFGTPRQALQALRGLLKPSGTLVFADLCWSAKPSPKYLQYLETSEGDYWMVEEAETVFAEAGLKVKVNIVASADSWARYEAGVLRGRLEFAKALPPDQAAEISETSTEWYLAYEEHGRHCLGFSAFVATRSDD